MKNYLLIIVILFLTACLNKAEMNSEQNKRESNSLKHINHSNKLILKFVDAKCGEWGGNERNVTIYREWFDTPLLADYVEKTMNCDSFNKFEITKSIKKIKLTQEDNDLVIDCIEELTNFKLARNDYPSHAGLRCQVMLTDSSLFIEDFPSFDWKKFKLLCIRLINSKSY